MAMAKARPDPASRPHPNVLGDWSPLLVEREKSFLGPVEAWFLAGPWPRPFPLPGPVCPEELGFPQCLSSGWGWRGPGVLGWQCADLCPVPVTPTGTSSSEPLPTCSVVGGGAGSPMLPGPFSVRAGRGAPRSFCKFLSTCTSRGGLGPLDQDTPTRESPTHCPATVCAPRCPWHGARPWDPAV